MKIVSYNIRGLGTAVKKRNIRKLVTAENPDFLYIQETKREIVDARLCLSLWGNNDFAWVFSTSIGRSGGMISIWKKNSFSKFDSFSGLGYLGVSGTWANGTSCNLINIYSPCEYAGKMKLWKDILDVMPQRGGEVWGVMGDFNSILSSSEK